ncbi:MAG: GNAT family N-acetyltransferase [Ruminococcaceae bacterium]|nr:GNAT family N-acetyltransferase [Oscillospiraceae bacterium]
MDKNICCGRGENVLFSDFMDLINISFSCTSPESDLRNLLPKLYREQFCPQKKNYVVTEDGNPVAAVGAYDHEIRVCGRTLACRGIGNVGVHPNYRSKGYMKLAMNSAMRDMIKDGVVLSTLGGRRQRYQYFGYDTTGPVYRFSISRENIHHVFGDCSAPFTLREITDPHDKAIDLIIELNEKSPITPIRPKNEYLYIANSWHAKLISVENCGRFVGYLILNKNNVTEIEVVNDLDFLPLIRSLYAFIGENYSVTLFPHQIGYRRALTPFAENMSIGSAMQFNILNYRAVTEAFLALKLAYDKLPDGEIVLLIHGYASDERIRIAVKDGEGFVEEVDENTPENYELSHAEALSFLFSPISPLREEASDIARLYFPLPLSMRRADEV